LSGFQIDRRDGEDVVAVDACRAKSWVVLFALPELGAAVLAPGASFGGNGFAAGGLAFENMFFWSEEE
jgi:hypothetical protein